MNLYVVDYRMPFPMSEYGGSHVIAAENVDQVVDICLADTGSYVKHTYGEGIEKRIREGCIGIGTTDLFEKPCVVKSFDT